MKKISFIFIVLISVTGFAQQHKDFQKKDRPEFSTEERAILKSKKLALKLDLNESQRKDIEKIFSEETEKRAEFRRNREENTRKKASRFERMERHLDYQLAYQEKMRKVLEPAQYETLK